MSLKILFFFLFKDSVYYQLSWPFVRRSGSVRGPYEKRLCEVILNLGQQLRKVYSILDLVAVLS